MKNQNLGYRVVMTKIKDSSYKIAQAQVKNGKLTVAGASPSGDTPESLLESFSDYEESFNRDFILIDERGWLFADETDNDDVRRIRQTVRKGRKITFKPDKYEPGRIYMFTPPNHYRIGFDAKSKLASVFQIHDFLRVGSDGRINGACAFGYSADEFVEDWLMYKHSLKLNMFISQINPKTHTDVVESDLPFTLAQWRAGRLNDVKDVDQTQISEDASSVVWMRTKLSEPVMFKLTFYSLPKEKKCGLILNQNSIVDSITLKQAAQSVREKVIEMVVNRYQGLGLPTIVADSLSTKEEISVFK